MDDRPVPVPTEERLIEAAQAGDHRAFDRLVVQYQDHLYRKMMRACHHPQDAEEVALDALARAYERLSQFEGRSSFVTWLGRIATNLCLRRRERAQVPSVSLEEITSSESGGEGRMPPAPSATPEQQALRTEMSRVVRSALDSLPEPDRTVVVLRDIEQMSAQEVSERTGLTVPAVKSRLHRARGRLRERLNDYFLLS